MKFYLVQHGEACTKEVDPDRPLTERGRDTVERIGVFLHQSGINFDRVVHSGKLRAAQTAEILANIIAPEQELQTSSSISPNDDPASFDWRSECNNGDTLIVGHLPFMAKLVSHLLIGDSERVIVSYQPGSIVCLEFEDNSGWYLNWMIRPELFVE